MCIFFGMIQEYTAGKRTIRGPAEPVRGVVPSVVFVIPSGASDLVLVLSVESRSSACGSGWQARVVTEATIHCSATSVVSAAIPSASATLEEMTCAPYDRRRYHRAQEIEDRHRRDGALAGEAQEYQRVPVEDQHLHDRRDDAVPALKQPQVRTFPLPMDNPSRRDPVLRPRVGQAPIG